MLTAGAAARGSGRRPQVHLVDGRVLVYDPASAATLLSEHRIWATPVGVRRARNKSPEHSFPCVLSPEQATLVLRRRLADVFYPRHSSASEAGCHGHETLEERHSDDGDGGAEEQEDGSRLYKMDLVIPQDYAQEIKRRISSPILVDVTIVDPSARRIIEKYRHQGSPSKIEQQEANVPMTTKKVCHDPPRLLDSEWRFPEIAVETKSMAVFEDLWAKGLCPASGSNYAADFVVYNGPPTERHSIAAVIVCRGANDELSPAEVSGFARVQQAVGKRAVIATAPLATNDTSPMVVGANKLASAAAAAAAVVTPRGSERKPTGVEDRTSTPRRHEGGQETASGTVSGTASEELPTPAPAAADVAAATAAATAAAAAAAANEGVRYITLQFHSVSSRV